MSVEGWRRTAIQDLAADIKGSFIDGDWIEAPYITDQGIRLIQTGNIGVGGFIDKNKKYISEDAFVELKCKEVYIGDILICRLADPIGRSCIVPNLENKAITSVDVCILRIDEKKYDKHFIAHSLNKQSFLDICQQTAGGSTRQRISRTNLGKIEIDIPKHKREQEQIAAILSTIDRAIAQTEAIISKQQRIKTGLMQDLLTKGIDEHGNIRSEATHEFKDSAIGRIPVQWDEIKLCDVGTWLSGGTPSKSEETYWGSFMPWVCSKDMKVFDLENTLEMITEKGVLAGGKVAPKDSVLIIVRGMILAHTFPVGYLTKDMAFNQDIKAIIPNENIYGRYLAYWFSTNSSQLLKLTTTATHGTKRLDTNDLFEFSLRLPPKTEQNQIIVLMDKLQYEIETSKKYLLKLAVSKTGLMQDLLTGKVRVTELLKERDKIG